MSVAVDRSTGACYSIQMCFWILQLVQCSAMWESLWNIWDPLKFVAPTFVYRIGSICNNHVVYVQNIDIGAFVCVWINANFFSRMVSETNEWLKIYTDKILLEPHTEYFLEAVYEDKYLQYRKCAFECQYIHKFSHW